MKGFDWSLILIASTAFVVAGYGQAPVKVPASVEESVEVRATEVPLDTSAPEAFKATGMQVLQTAGGFGDVSRYGRQYPGFISTSDMSNEFLVRGGSPLENSFSIDGVQVPNINHLSTLGTTGGFGPMISATAVRNLTVLTGGYGAQYPEALSSIMEITTLDVLKAGYHIEADAGIQGAGGQLHTHAPAGDLLVTAYRGVLNLVTRDIGMNGVPTYTNWMTVFQRIGKNGDRFTALSIGGWDGINIMPCALDFYETTSVDSQYRGSRETAGVEWRHITDRHSFVQFGASDSEQIEHLAQQDQIPDPLKLPSVTGTCGNATTPLIPVYNENSNSAFSKVEVMGGSSFLSVSIEGGSALWFRRPHFNVDQPNGAYDPYSTVDVRSDKTSFNSDLLSTWESGSFLQITAYLKNVTVSAGGRVQTFAFGDYLTTTPRVSVSYRFANGVNVYAAYGRYAQLPPYVYLVAYPENHALLPMRDSHDVLGLKFGFAKTNFRIEAYDKPYRNVPASTQYGSVTIHTLADILGQQFVWLPMASGGHGRTAGVEASVTSQIGTRITWQANAAYARARFAGIDGVLRPSNYDLPWIINAAGIASLGKGWSVSFRYGFSSGKAYTPFDLSNSTAQNRPIYDLNRINASRSPIYSRLDAQLIKPFSIKGKIVEVYLGVDNIFNRANFFSYAWCPRAWGSGSDQTTIVPQMPVYPNFGVRWKLR